MNKHFRFSGSTFRRLEELGVRPLRSFDGPGYPRDTSIRPAVLKTEELFAFWRAVGELSTNPAIGLQLGTENRTERFLLTGLAALASESFGAAVDQMARYKQLTCPEEILQKSREGEWSIQFRWLLANQVEPPVLIECAFSWMLSIARHGTGTRPDWTSVSVDMDQAPRGSFVANEA